MAANLSRQCKLCAAPDAKATYNLSGTTVYRCPECDLHFIPYLDPPDDNSGAPKQLNGAGRKYLEMRQNEGRHLPPRRLELLRQHTRLDHIRLLDIGAGIGQFQRLATRSFPLETFGIEPSSLRRQYALEQFGIPLVDKRVEDSWWQNSHLCSFDVITLWDVIEHVNDPVATLKHANKLLKPGGILALDTPDRRVFSYRLSETIYRLSGGRLSLFLDSFYAAIPYGHKQIFTRKQLTDLFEKIGLQIIADKSSYRKTRRQGERIILLGQKPSGNHPL